MRKQMNAEGLDYADALKIVLRNNLVLAMHKKNINEADAAQLSNMKTKTIKYILNHPEKSEAETIIRIAHAIGVDLPESDLY
jgi:plasmid maintenance system antidote protein VapI